MKMRAMLLTEQGKPLVSATLPLPSFTDDELLIKVHACGVCRTDLHIQEGDLPAPRLPLILGHEIVGTVEKVGNHAQGFKKGDRVGVPWLAGSCGKCAYCLQGSENLCDHGVYTGYLKDGGFAEYTVCKAEFAIPLPASRSDAQIAPLLCAGLIGYRAYRKAHPHKTLGIYGFGAAAHIIAQIAVQQGKDVYAFTREGDREGQAFAKKLGAIWAGGSESAPPQALDAALIFAPIGSLVPKALKALKKGGRCICGGIHMSDIPSFPYKDLWGEKIIESVANLSRQDAREFFALLPKIPLHTQVTTYSLEKANDALQDLKKGKFQGAAVIQMF